MSHCHCCLDLPAREKSDYCDGCAKGTNRACATCADLRAGETLAAELALSGVPRRTREALAEAAGPREEVQK